MNWTRTVKNEKRSSDVEDLTFSQAVDEAVKCLEPRLLSSNEMSHDDNAVSQLTEKLRQDAHQYFKTGNLGPANKASFNPTLIHKNTSDWLVHHSLSPFDGYCPLPVKELMGKMEIDENGIALRYFQVELKKLLIAFRMRADDVKFFFHPIDPLVFCYKELSLKFDLIDTAILTDDLGLVNIFNAAARVLRTDDSVLLTQTREWPHLAKNLSDYVQKVLCCPLSLIPSIYGLRWIDNIQLMETPLPTRRLCWKKVPILDGVPLVLSPVLEQSLDRLKKVCFHISPSGAPVYWETCGLACYSPLTFRYVLNNFIRLSGFVDPSAVMSAALSGLPQVFRKSLDVGQALMERRPVWKVKIGVLIDSLAERMFEKSQAKQFGTPVLRLILLPLSSTDGDPSASSVSKWLSNLHSTENHFIDNLDLEMSKLKPMLDNSVEFSFLLNELSVLDTRFGIVYDSNAPDCPLFGTPHLIQRSVELFNQPYPWFWEKSSSSSHPLSESSGKSPQLLAKSCLESEEGYNIRVISADLQSLSGNELKIF